MRETEKMLRTYFQEDRKERGILSEEGTELSENTKNAMQKTILMAELEIREREKRKENGFGTLLIELLRAAGIRMWIFQAGVVLGAYLLMYFLMGVEIQYFTPRRFAFIVSLLGIFMFSAAIPSLYRTKRYQMLEIEAAAKCSVWKLMLARILVIGTGDLLMLIGVIWWVSSVSPLSVLQAAFCLCLPFLLAFDGGLYLLRKVAFVHFQKWAYGMCLGMTAILGGVAFFYPAYYEMDFTFVTVGSILVLAVVGIYQCVGLTHETEQSVYG